MKSFQSWRILSSKFLSDESQIYYINLKDIKDDECAFFFDTLSMEEQNKASKMIYPIMQKFIVCRALCKKILCAKLGIKNLDFCYLNHGKPYIKDHKNLFFNISHSNNVAILCLSTKSPIGVDIEFVDKTCNFKELMDIFMFPNEKRWVLEEDSVYRFFMLWTMKEAILKRTGDGISSKGYPKIKIEKYAFWHKSQRIKNFFIENKKYSVSIA